MSAQSFWWLRGALAAAALGLAAVRFFLGNAEERMDLVFLALVAAAAMILLLPWERLTSLKAAGIEVQLGQPHVQGAVEGLGLDDDSERRLRTRLARLDRELAQVRGSRVLWIDDNPHLLVGVRRVLRSLGVEIEMTTSTEQALGMLEHDSDFDLLITDVQRAGQSHQHVEKAIDIHEGVNFVVWLRQQDELPEHVRKIPVVFYAAFRPDALAKWTAAARAFAPPADFCNKPEELIPKVVKSIAEARAEPIVLEPTKVPTRLS